MKKIFFIIALCLLATPAFGKDIKFYDKNYRYTGKINTDTGRIYDRNYRYVGKISESGNVYDNKNRPAGKIRFNGGNKK